MDEGKSSSENVNDSLEKRFRRINISSAFTFIFLGIILLLNTSGIISWSVWGGFFLIFLRIWPIFLIILGIRIILKNSFVVEIIMGLMWLLILSILVLYSFIFYSQNSTYTNQLKSDFPFIESFVKSLNVSSNQLTDTKEFIQLTSDTYSKRIMNIDLTAGEVNVSEQDNNKYVGLNSVYSENKGVPSLEEISNNGNVNFNFKQIFNSVNFMLSQVLKYDFTIGVLNLPTDFNLNMTAGNGNISLSKVLIDKLNAKITAGNLSVNLKDKSLPNNISVTLTAGNLDLTLPKDVGLDVNYKGLAGVLTINGVQYENGTHIINENSSKIVNIDLNQTAGKISLNLN